MELRGIRNKETNYMKGKIDFRKEVYILECVLNQLTTIFSHSL